MKFYLILLPFLLLSCTKKEGDQIEQKVRINFAYSPLSSDPRKKSDPVTSVLSHMTFEGLMHLEPDGSLSKGLAEDVFISDDGLTYNFTIREARWSDGRPITAYDFEKSWKKLLGPKFPSGCAEILYSVKNAKEAKKGQKPLSEIGVTALDDRHLKVTLEVPAPYFLFVTAYCTTFPVPDGQDRDSCHDRVSSGPFFIDSLKHDDQIVLNKNPYFREVESIAIEQIEISLIKDEATSLALYEKGELDYVGGMTSPLPLDASAHIKKRVDYHHKEVAETTFCAFNLSRFPFTNINIRKAFSYAIDRQEIIDNITQMEEEVATGPVSPILKQFKRKKFLMRYHPDLARKYLELGCSELGITPSEFPNLTYHYFSSELHSKVATALQGQWRKVLGIKVLLKQTDLKIYHALLREREFDIAQMSWIAQYPDQMNFLERFRIKGTTRNYSGWENSDFQSLLDASQTEGSSETRFRILEKAESLIMDDMPIAPLYHYNACYLTSPRLQGLEVSPLGDIQFKHARIVKKT